MGQDKLTRREFLIATAVTAGGGALVACGGRTGPATGSSTQPAAQGTAAMALPDTKGKRVFAESTPNPPTGRLEGGPQWQPKNLSGQKLTLWGLQYDPHVERYHLLANEFKKLTGAEVTVQPQEELVPKILASLAAGNPPDVVCMIGVGSAQLWKQKAMLPIDELVFQTLRIDMDKWWRPGAIGAYKWVDGKHYGVPVEDNWVGYTVTSRKDLIEKAGADAKALWPGSKGEKGVWFDSYEEMFTLAEMLQKANNKGGKVKLWGLNSQGWEGHSLLGIMRSLGTEWWEPDAKKFNMASDACVEGIELLVEAPYKRGIESMLGVETQINGFVAGQVALARGNGSAAGEAWKLKIEGENVIAPHPQAGKTPLFMGEGGWGFQIPARAKNKDAAVEFLNFMCTYEAQYIFSQIYGGSPPACSALVGSDIYEGNHPVKVGLRRQLKALENTVFLGHGYGTWENTSTVIGETFGLVREKKMKAKDASQQIQKRLEANLKQWDR